MDKRWLLSVITPAFNEAENLPQLYPRLASVSDVLAALGGEMEWIVVDDGSSDATADFVRQIAENDSRVHLIRLTHNCGSHAAIAAGLAHCNGDCAAVIAADLQNPPEIIVEMAQLWKQGFYVVWALRRAYQGAPWVTRAASAAYYWLMRRLALPKMPSRGIGTFLLDRKVINCCKTIGEKHTSLFALVLWMGFPDTFITYAQPKRKYGVSKWTFSKKLKLFMDSIISFTSAPITTMWIVGLLFCLMGLAFLLVSVMCRALGCFVFGLESAIIITILLIGQGSILCSLAALGQYLWRAYDQVRGRPRYLIEYVFPNESQRHLGGTSGERTTSQKNSEPAGVPNSPKLLAQKDAG